MRPRPGKTKPGLWNTFRKDRLVRDHPCHLRGYTLQLLPMIQVTRKDSKESLENLLRRFTRKVQQSGVIAVAKQNQYFEKPMSKRDRRQKAIIRRERKNIKLKKMKLGQR